MRTAPAVRVTLNDAGAERVLITALHAVTGAVLVAWVARQVGWQGAAATWPMVVLVVVAFAALGRRLAAQALPAAHGAQLAWDGQRWQLGRQGAGPGVPLSETPLTELVVALDLGAWLLLRLRPLAEPSRWYVLRAAPAGPQWHGLRVALACHAGAQAVAGLPPSS